MPYCSDRQAMWDDFVRRSRNGTFLLERGYMDYHRDRFQDASLIAHDDQDWLAVLPAHRTSEALISHGGLTYGGWVLAPRMTASRMAETFDATETWLRGAGVRSVIYKPMPFIYAKTPSQEDLFCLFTRGARLTRRDVLAVVDSRHPLPLQTRRQRGVKKAQKEGVMVSRDDAALAEYWAMLEHNLAERHDAKPVHTLAEMALLMGRFPNNIQLFVARRAGALLAGILVYDTETTARTQYISSTPEGRDCGALDLLISQLLTNTFPTKPYIDLGSSMQKLGVIDSGLMDQKEGFGARSLALDTWEWQLP